MGGKGVICFFIYIFIYIYEQIEEKVADGIGNMMEIVRYESGDRDLSSHNHTNESCGLWQGLLNLPWKLTRESSFHRLSAPKILTRNESLRPLVTTLTLPTICSISWA